MKYLITGGAGFIGSHLTDALIERGDEVVVIDNLSTGSHKNLVQVVEHSKFELIEGNVLEQNLLDEVISRVDHVLHFAAAVGVFNIVDRPLNSLKINLRGTENVLEVAQKYKKPVLLASTSEIYGKNSGGPLGEESDRIIGSPLKSRWSYSEAKAIDESLAFFYYQEFGLPIRIIRFFNTVGPRQVGHYGMVVPRFVEAAIAGNPLKVYGDGNQSRCFCHVRDAVKAVLRVIDSEISVGKVYNVGNNQEISIRLLAEKVISQLYSNSKIDFVPYDTAYGSGFEDMQRRIPDISRIENELNWKPSESLDQVISDIAAQITIS